MATVTGRISSFAPEVQYLRHAPRVCDQQWVHTDFSWLEHQILAQLKETDMAVDFKHPYVGRRVVYRAGHPGAPAEEGVVSSVNVEAGIVFVRYGDRTYSQATTPSDLRFLSGEAVTL